MFKHNLWKLFKRLLFSFCRNWFCNLEIYKFHITLKSFSFGYKSWMKIWHFIFNTIFILLIVSFLYFTFKVLLFNKSFTLNYSFSPHYFIFHCTPLNYIPSLSDFRGVYFVAIDVGYNLKIGRSDNHDFI